MQRYSGHYLRSGSLTKESELLFEVPSQRGKRCEPLTRMLPCAETKRNGHTGHYLKYRLVFSVRGTRAT